jgi:hypothetical protein
MVAPVLMTAAGMALFLNICDLAAGSHLSIAANHAAARQSAKAEKPNETHHVLPLISEQDACRDPFRRFAAMPLLPYRHLLVKSQLDTLHGRGCSIVK